jgi:uncharacterized protein YkwD
MQRHPSTLVRAIVPVFVGLLLASPLAQGRSAIEEIRQGLKLTHLQQINADRLRHGLPPVRLDSFASVMADRYCEQQIRERVTGHFTLSGDAPYMRYSYAGGHDGVSENAAAWSANYTFSDAMLPDLMQQSQRAMMAEVPPKDGHRRTILDPHATHVGIGLAWSGGEFRLVQEFIRRYIEWDRTPQSTAAAGDRALLSGKPYAGYSVEAISVHHERHPLPISATVANRIDTYGLPKYRRDYLPRRGSRGHFRLEDGAFSFAVPLVDGPGVYTVVVWVRHDSSPDLIAASNISIRAWDVRGGIPNRPLTSR